MGIKDVVLTDLITQLDGTYSLYGENFTKIVESMSMARRRALNFE